MNVRRKFLILGAGGHARVVISTILASGNEVVGILDDDQSNPAKSLLGIPILGISDMCHEVAHDFAIIAIGNSVVRKQLAEKYNLNWGCAIHPFSFIDTTAKVGPGTVVFAGAVIQPEVRIGSHCIVNTSSSVDHECALGDFTQIAPGAHLGGRVLAEEGAFVGLGASIRQGIRLGEWSVVGAGATVVTSVEPKSVVVGTPAKLLRLNEDVPKF